MPMLSIIKPANWLNFTNNTIKHLSFLPQSELKSSFLRSFNRLWPYLLILGAPFMVYWYWLDAYNGKIIGNDFLLFPFKQEYYFSLLYRLGYFPLWVHESLGGSPALNYLIGQPYFPLNWWRYGVDAYFGEWHIWFFVVQKLTLLGVGGCFFYGWLRQKSFTAAIALFGTALFLFNSRMLDSIRYGTSFDTIIFIAPNLFFVERLLNTRRGVYACLLAASTGMQLLAGYPQMFFYSVMFLGAYFLFGLWNRAKNLSPSAPQALNNGRKIRKLLGQYTVAHVVALLLGAVFLVPFMLDVQPFVRSSALNYSFALQYQNTPADLLFSVFLPWFADVHSAMYSSSVVWMLLVVLALVGLKQLAMVPWVRMDILFLTLMLVLCVAISLGEFSFAFDFFWRVVPGFNINRSQGRILILAQICVIVLACHALRYLVYSKRSSELFTQKTALLLSLAVLATLLLLLMIHANLFPELKNYLLRLVSGHSGYKLNGQMQLMPKFMWQTLFYPLAFILLLRWMSLKAGKPKYLVLLLCLLASLEAAQYLKFGTWYSQHPKEPSPNLEYFTTTDFYHNRRIDSWFNRSLINPAHERTIQIERAADKRMVRFHKDASTRIRNTFYQDTKQRDHYFPRLHWVPKVEVTSKEDFSRINGSNPYFNVVLNENDVANAETLANRPTALPDIIKTTEKEIPEFQHHATREEFVQVNSTQALFDFTNNRVRLELETPSPGVLVFMNNFRSGWKATINGKATPILRVNHTFQAVVLTAGSHQVEFLYYPTSMKLGLQLSLLALGGLAIWVVWALNIKRWYWRLIVGGMLIVSLYGIIDSYYHVEQRILRGGKLGVTEMDLNALLQKNLK